MCKLKYKGKTFKKFMSSFFPSHFTSNFGKLPSNFVWNLATAFYIHLLTIVVHAILISCLGYKTSLLTVFPTSPLPLNTATSYTF